MAWISGTVVAILALAALSVWVRRRYGVARLFGVALAAWTCLAGAGLILVGGLARGVLGSGGFAFGLVLVLGAVTGGTAALGLAVHRIVESSTIPDPLPETAFGAIAFVGGTLGGLIVGVTLVALTYPFVG